MSLVGGNGMDEPKKLKILENGVKFVRRHIGTCTIPNIRPVAARMQKRPTKFDFFAGEVL